MMKSKVAVILAAVLMLVGCSAISSGIITKKNYYPSYNYNVMYCAAYNNKGMCVVWSSRVEHVPDSWKFDIRNDNKDTGWVYVSEDEYNRYDIGDYYGER